ncbi:RHOMBOID-like protein 10, chloroplastic [Coccomyxa sp. Obi]|nr:RHOMBOID-like protein 10, chloroplastic [Coccomyxa sp. Obi]
MFEPGPISSRTAVQKRGFLVAHFRLNIGRLALLAAAGRRTISALNANGLQRSVLCNSGALATTSAFGVLSLLKRQRRPRRQSRQVATRTSSRNEFGAPHRRVTDFLLVLNAAAFIAQIVSKDRLLLLGAKDNQLIRAGEWWRLITPVALHASWLHLLTNNYSLNSLGPAVEGLCGRQRFVSVYTASALMGSVASYALNPSPSVGASGAIFGLGGALAVYAARHRKLMGSRGDAILQSLGQSLILNLAIGLTTPRIDQWGHLGGLIGGAMTAYLLGPNIQVIEGRGGKRQVQDNPPLPIFASKL